MPSYKAPVRDTLFVINELLRLESYRQSARFRECQRRYRRGGDRRGGQVRQRSARPAQCVGRCGRLHAPCRWHGDDADRLQAGLRPVSRGRLGHDFRARTVWRAGHAGSAGFALEEFLVLVQPVLRDVSGADQRRDCRDSRQGLAGIAADLCAQDGLGRMDRDDEPDRAALRHRSRPDPHPRRAARRRVLCDHRHQDLHLRRRTRHGREHHPSGAGQNPRCARFVEGHLAVHRAQISARCRWQAGGAQRGFLRLDRTQDGHSRQRHLRDEL